MVVRGDRRGVIGSSGLNIAIASAMPQGKAGRAGKTQIRRQLSASHDRSGGFTSCLPSIPVISAATAGCLTPQRTLVRHGSNSKVIQTKDRTGVRPTRPQEAGASAISLVVLQVTSMTSKTPSVGFSNTALNIEKLAWGGKLAGLKKLVNPFEYTGEIIPFRCHKIKL